MKQLLTLLRHELRALLIAPASYAAGVLFLLIMGLIYVLMLEQSARYPDELSPAAYFFQGFWIPVCLMVPLITMRSLAEERRLGTLESMLTTPVNAVQVVIAKYLAAYLYYVALWLLTLSFPYIVLWQVPSVVIEGELLDPATLIGGYSFIAVSGLLYIAIGIFASSLTRTQLIAGMLSFCLLFILVVFGQMISELPIYEYEWLRWLEEPANTLQPMQHLEDFSRGIIDSRPFFFYFSTTCLLLGITVLVVESKA